MYRVPKLRKCYRLISVITITINTNITIITAIEWEASKWYATETSPWP